MTRAAIYVRQSLDRSGEALAVSRQESECRELIEHNRWEVAEVYSDNDKSASSGKPRPDWARLLADLKAGRHDVLVCWHTDRLYRRLRDLVDLVEIAESRSLKIASVKAADIDLSSPAGRMLAGMLGHAARYEVEQKGARQVAANRASAKRGDIGWTRRPFGYDRQSGKVVIVAAEAKELRAAARKVLKGATLASIVADLNSRGVVTSLGGRWNVTGLKRVLLNPRVAGRAVSLGEDYGTGNWKPILDADTADRLQATLIDPRRRTAPNNLAVKYLLSGIAVCGKCGDEAGAKMYASPAGSPTGGQWMIYRCRTQHLGRRLDLVDKVVEGVLLERLSRADALALLVPDIDIDALRADVVELRDRRDGIAAMLAEGLISTDAARREARGLTEKISTIERQLADATGEGPTALLVTADDVGKTWERMTLVQQREVIRTLMTVTILPAGRGARFDPASIRIDWHN
jgi:site-specific DNA recombinase